MNKEKLENDEIRIQMPSPVKEIIRTLTENGYEAYAVGGCVRDACLGRVPHDWDMTTSARPEEVKALFRRTVDTGIEHGTVTIMIGSEGYEVTTYRLDGVYEDARHPKKVTFTPELREDLRRRDFTINAMAYNDEAGLVDLFDGRRDLENGIIRCVGEAKERFGEDALRILRAVRFSAQLGFAIDGDTAKAASLLAPNLAKISAERIYTELSKMLTSAHPDRLLTAYELGITAVILPELDEAMKTGVPAENLLADAPKTVGLHGVRAVQQIRPDLALRLTMLLHDLAKADLQSGSAAVRIDCADTDTGEAAKSVDGRAEDHAARSAKMADGIMKRLKSDRASQRLVHELIAAHSSFPEADAPSVRRMASRMGREKFSLYLEVKRADILAKRAVTMEQDLAHLMALEHIWQQVQAAGDPLQIGELSVAGKDLKDLGMKPGKAMGEVLGALLALVLEDPAQNVREVLLGHAKRLATELSERI